MAAPVQEGVSLTDIEGATSGNVNLPGTSAADDILLMCLAFDGDAANPAATGYTQVGPVQEGSVEVYWLWKRSAGGESGTQAITWTGTEECRVFCFRFSGCVASGSPIDVIGTGNTGNAATAAVNAITTTVVDTVAIAFCGVDRNVVDAADGLTVANGFTEQSTSGNTVGVSGVGSLVATKTIASITSSLSPTFGTWTADGFATQMINLKPVVAAGGFAHSQGYVIG